MRVGNIHESQAGLDVTKKPTEEQTQTLRRHSDPVTPLRIRNVDDNGRYEEEALDISTMDDEDDQQTTRQAGTRDAAEQAASASVDVTADVEPHDPHSEQGGRHGCAKQPRPQQPRRKQPRRRQQPLHRRNPRRRAGTVVRLHKESNTQSGRPAGSKQIPIVDSQAEPDLLEAGRQG